MQDTEHSWLTQILVNLVTQILKLPHPCASYQRSLNIWLLKTINIGFHLGEYPLIINMFFVNVLLIFFFCWSMIFLLVLLSIFYLMLFFHFEISFFGMFRSSGGKLKGGQVKKYVNIEALAIYCSLSEVVADSRNMTQHWASDFLCNSSFSGNELSYLLEPVNVSISLLVCKFHWFHLCQLSLSYITVFIFH